MFYTQKYIILLSSNIHSLRFLYIFYSSLSYRRILLNASSQTQRSLREHSQMDRAPPLDKVQNKADFPSKHIPVPAGEAACHKDNNK
jgi:hypothetical protein